MAAGAAQSASGPPPERPAPPAPTTPAAQKYDLTTCVSLLTCFDFEQRGLVDREEWRKGTQMMMLGAMGEDDALWRKLVSSYGEPGVDAVALSRIVDLVPMDPRVSLMMRAMVASVANVTTQLERSRARAVSQSQTRANRVILLMRRKIIEPVLHAWASYVGRTKMLGRKALRAALSGALGRAWRQWSGQAALMAARAAQLRKFASRAIHSVAGKGWRQWAAWHAERVRMRAFGRRLMHSHASRAMNQWAEAAAEGARRRRQLRKAGARLVMREAVLAMEHWRELAAQVRRMRKMMRRCLHREAALAWRRWEEMLEERSVMASVLSRALNRALAAGWSRWVEHVDERQRLRGVASRVARRMMNRLAASVFDAWAEAVAAAIADRESKRRRAVNNFRMRSVALCFGAWSTVVGSGAERERLMRRLLGRLMQKAVALCLEAWVESTRRDVELRAKYAARWANGLVAKVFLAWVAATRHEAEVKVRMRQIAIRMSRRTEVLVLQEWRTWVVEARGYLRVALARWVNEAINAAFEGWHRRTAEALRFKELGAKVLGRYRNQLLARCYLAWANHAGAAAQQREAARARALAFLSGRHELILQLRFRAWRDLAASAKTAREARMRGILMRVRMRAAAMCWQAWLDTHVEIRAVKRAARQWMGMASAKAFRHWATHCAALRRNKALLEKCFARYRNQLATKVLLSWADATRFAIQTRERRRLKSLALMSDREGLVLRLRFNAWRSFIVAIRGRKEELGRKLLGRYANQALAKTFLAWVAHVRLAQAEAERKLLRAAAFLSGKAELMARLCFEALRAAADERRGQREELVRRALLRLRHGLLHVCFHAWLALLRSNALRAAAEPVTLPEDVPSVDLSPMVESLKGFGEAMGTMLDSMHGLTTAVAEMRVAAELGPAAGSAEARLAGGDAASWVKQRLEDLEAGLRGQLEAAGTSLRRSEKLLAESAGPLAMGAKLAQTPLNVPLHPLPVSALSAAGSSMLRSEVTELGRMLATTRRELADCNKTKAYRYELASMRSELHSFLFGNGLPTAAFNAPRSATPDDIYNFEYEEEAGRRQASSSSLGQGGGVSASVPVSRKPSRPQSAHRRPEVGTPAKAGAPPDPSSEQAGGRQVTAEFGLGVGSGSEYGSNFPRRPAEGGGLHHHPLAAAPKPSQHHVPAYATSASTGAGHAPAPPGRPRPKSAAVKASPRTRAIGGEPLQPNAPYSSLTGSGRIVHAGGGGGGGGYISCVAGQRGDGGVSWASKTHFSQHLSHGV